MVESFWRLDNVLPSETNGHGQMAMDLSRIGNIPLPNTSGRCGLRYEEATARVRIPATVLVAEDDRAVLKLLANSLRREGYQILPASDGKQALQVGELYDGPIDALVTDVMIYHALGTEVAYRLMARRPQLRVICMSGCLHEEFDANRVMAYEWSFLQKPFTLDQLRRTLRATLERRDRLQPGD